MACGNQYYDCNGNLKKGQQNNMQPQVNAVSKSFETTLQKHQVYGKPSTKLNIKIR